MLSKTVQILRSHHSQPGHLSQHSLPPIHNRIYMSTLSNISCAPSTTGHLRRSVSGQKNALKGISSPLICARGLLLLPRVEIRSSVRARDIGALGCLLYACDRDIKAFSAPGRGFVKWIELERGCEPSDDDEGSLCPGGARASERKRKRLLWI